jgi:hypothetical protein
MPSVHSASPAALSPVSRQRRNAEDSSAVKMISVPRTIW